MRWGLVKLATQQHQMIVIKCWTVTEIAEWTSQHNLAMEKLPFSYFHRFTIGRRHSHIRIIYQSSSCNIWSRLSLQFSSDQTNAATQNVNSKIIQPSLCTHTHPPPQVVLIPDSPTNIQELHTVIGHTRTLNRVKTKW